MSQIKDLFKYAFDFVGVENRKNYWIAIGFSIGLILLLLIVSFFIDWFIILFALAQIVLTIPMLSLTARRLHDTDRSAFNMFWLFAPIVGIVIISIYCLEETKYYI